MNARMQPKHTLTAPDLDVLLALVRAGNLAGAGQLIGVDGSTVFRSVKRAESALGQRLFERSRAGYRPTEVGLRLAQHAERIETELEGARATAQADGGAVSGAVRISTTDDILSGLLMPALGSLMAQHPGLQIEVSASNQLANLTQRDADIALRATKRPPPHVVGRLLGPIRLALFGARALVRGRRKAFDPSGADWIALDDALPECASAVQWRRRHHPQVVPRILVNNIQSVFDGIVAGAGIGVVPLFMAQARDDVVALSESIAECETQLWLLTHPESRHLRRISTVASYLSDAIVLR